MQQERSYFRQLKTADWVLRAIPQHARPAYLTSDPAVKTSRPQKLKACKDIKNRPQCQEGRF